MNSVQLQNKGCSRRSKAGCDIHYCYATVPGKCKINSICETQDARNQPLEAKVSGWHRREMFFVAKILLTQPLKSQKFDYPTSNIN
jgi:hypothetical protein